MTKRFRLGWTGLAIVATLGIGIPALPAASAQIPEGLDPATVADMIPSTISVPAGQTTSVDVGAPVSASYSGGGWSVSSFGTGVTVTAPNQPGSQVSVPVSAGGYSATITLVAEDTAGAAGTAGDGGSGTPAGGSAGEPGTAGQEGTSDATDQAGQSGQPGQAGQESNQETGSAGAEAVSTPPRQPAAPVDTTQAQQMYFDGEIHGNVLTVTVSLTEAADLARLASGNSEGLKLRYLDINGQIIEGVQRDIDMGARTMALTYPEGQTPDNPFIMEVVRGDSVAEYIVTITATNAPVAQPNATDDAQPNAYADVVQEADQARQEDNSNWVWWAVLAGAIVIVAALVAVVFAVRKRSRRRR